MRRLFFGVGILVLLIGVAVLWWRISLLPVDSSSKSTKNFTVTSGESIRDIATNLKAKNLIRDQVAYFILMRLGLEKSPQAGNFTLSPAMSTEEVAKTLTLGTQDVWLTVPEGWRNEEIVQYLQSQGVTGEVSSWHSQEGKYFPETYKAPRSSTLEDIRQLMLKTYASKTAGLDVTDEDLILASLVEREAKNAADRPVIAGVFLNRLNAGMGLDVDATIQYAIGYTKADGWWKKELTIDDLAIKSPYNTYKNAGLPPTPICNPGMQSIQAVLNPTKSDYLYYLTGKDGQMHYAKTLDAHNANVAKYL